MNLTRDRVRSIGWAFVLTVCVAMTLALTLRVNAVKSEVRLAERQIVQIKREKMFLETEFLTRANQQQLKSLNDVEFGYQAPTAKQYIEGERQLAALGKARAPGAPTPIRVANPAEAVEGESFAMVSPLTGKAMAAVMPRAKMPLANMPLGGVHKPADAAGLRERLSRLEVRGAVAE